MEGHSGPGARPTRSRVSSRRRIRPRSTPSTVTTTSTSWRPPTARSRQRPGDECEPRRSHPLHDGLPRRTQRGGHAPRRQPDSPTGKYLDWPELYAKAQAAVYIGNTGFGYGDSASVALSERLLALFARNLHSNSGSAGEQWAETLGQYFATAGAYDVYDEKVMEETTFYGLPFWHFGTAPVTPLSGSLSSVKRKPLTTSSAIPVTSASLRPRSTRSPAPRARRSASRRRATRRSRSSASTGRSCRSRARR